MYDNIFNLIRSKDIRYYYRNMPDMSIEILKSIAICSHKPLSVKLEALKSLERDISYEHKKDIHNLVEYYQAMIDIFENPEAYFGDKYTFIYSITNYTSRYEITKDYTNDDGLTKFITYYSLGNSLDKIKNTILYDKYGDGIDVDIYMLIDGKLFSESISYTCYFNDEYGMCIPYYCDFYKNDYAKQNFNYSVIDTMEHAHHVRLNGLPYKNGDKLKVQTPCMDKPVYGYLWGELDGNKQWYQFLYETEDLTGNILFDLSYSMIKGEYAVFDWLEKAE